MLRMIAHCFVRTDTTRTQVEQAFADRRLAKVVPTFIAGLSEDITKRVSPRRRLFFTAMSAGLAVWLVDAVITKISQR